jgi:hypothetical protein
MGVVQGFHMEKWESTYNQVTCVEFDGDHDGEVYLDQK